MTGRGRKHGGLGLAVGTRTVGRREEQAAARRLIGDVKRRDEAVEHEQRVGLEIGGGERTGMRRAAGLSLFGTDVAKIGEIL